MKVVAIQVFGMLMIFFVFGLIGALAWPYTLNTWLVFIGKEAAIQWWDGFLLGMFPVIGQFSIPAAAITWILMLFIT